LTQGLMGRRKLVDTIKPHLSRRRQTEMHHFDDSSENTANGN